MTISAQNAQTPAQGTANPYRECLDNVVGQILNWDPIALTTRPRPKEIVHFDADSEWCWAEAAQHLLAIAYSYQSGGRWQGDPRLVAFAHRSLRMLIEAATEDRWYHRRRGKGDPNLDRFTLLPLMEAFALLREKIDANLADAVRCRILGVLEVQIQEYGRPSRAVMYPNMDAYYSLIMRLGHHLTGDRRFLDEAAAFLDHLVDSQFEDGAWTYYKGTNQCPVYHDLIVTLLGRMARLSKNTRILKLLRRSIPYYPLVVLPNGYSEFHTDPWWKHQWRPQSACGPDVVASLTGDGANRALGDRARPHSLSLLRELDTIPLNQLIHYVYAAWTWRPISPAPRPQSGIILDRNIEGPRGRFERWSWAATARYGCDTLVGAVVHDPSEEGLTALLGVVSEVTPRQGDLPDRGLVRMGLGMTPPQTTGHTTIDTAEARFQANYAMACFRSIWEAKPFPVRWSCRQHWRLRPTELVGRLALTCEEDPSSSRPLVRIRFGKDRRLIDQGGGHYDYGPLHLEIGASDFPLPSIQPAPMDRNRLTTEATELLLQPFADSNASAGQVYALELRFSLSESAVSIDAAGLK